MTEPATTDNLQLPLGLPAPVHHPSGDLMGEDKHFTMPLARPMIMSRVVGQWRENDRKLWVTLVALAWQRLTTQRIHLASASQIARLFRQAGGAENGSAWVLDCAKRLQQSSFQWDNENEAGTTSLLSGLKIIKSSGEIHYAFSDFLIEKILDNHEFARLRLHYMIGLSGKYTVSMYMLLQLYVNRQNPVCEMTLDELRFAMSIEGEKYKRWPDLQRNVVMPALEQINAKPKEAGFQVDVETVTRGKKTVKVRFIVKKVGGQKAPALAGQALRISHNASLKDIILSDEDALKIIRRVGPGLDAQSVLLEFRKAQKAKKLKNPGGFLTKIVRDKVKMVGDGAAMGRGLGQALRVSDD